MLSCSQMLTSKKRGTCASLCTKKGLVSPCARKKRDLCLSMHKNKGTCASPQHTKKGLGTRLLCMYVCMYVCMHVCMYTYVLSLSSLLAFSLLGTYVQLCRNYTGPYKKKQLRPPLSLSVLNAMDLESSLSTATTFRK